MRQALTEACSVRSNVGELTVRHAAFTGVQVKDTGWNSDKGLRDHNLVSATILCIATFEEARTEVSL